jgi:RND family efflux transporter MFP subunit
MHMDCNGSKQNLSVIVAGAVLILAMTGCNESTSASKAILPVRLAAAQNVTVGNSARYSADIVPYTQVDLSFKSNGYIDSVYQVRSAEGGMRNVDQGDWVEKNTVLALVHQQDYINKLDQAKAQLDRAQAEYEKAKLSFDRTSALYSTQSATKPDLDNAIAQLASTTAAVDSAKAQISEAEVALNYCSLRAPFAGWILKRNVDVGTLVGPATNGFTIADTRMVKAVFGVPDTSIGRVKVGQQLSITTDALPGNFTGRVTNISASADPKSRVYSVLIMIQNPANQLKSGMIASLMLGGEELAHPIIAVPLDAVIRDPSEHNAFAVLEAEGSGDTVTVRLRPVTVGSAYGNMLEITSGLSVGEKVVTTGASQVKNGDQARVVY